MKRVNEGSASYVFSYPRDADNEPSVPASMRYRIDCLTTCTEIAGWTSVVSPSTSNTITVTATQNRIINSCNRRERRQIVVETTNADGNARNDTLDWEVVNIRGVS